MTEISLWFGMPCFIHSNQAPEFISDLMHELSCSYRPQSDALVECFNQTLIDILWKFCGENFQVWSEHLPYLLCAYKVAFNESTSCSPNLTRLGHSPHRPHVPFWPFFLAIYMSVRIQWMGEKDTPREIWTRKGKPPTGCTLSEENMMREPRNEFFELVTGSCNSTFQTPETSWIPPTLIPT